MNKSVCLVLSMLDLSKTLGYEFQYDHVKPIYGLNTKPCYMDTDSFIVHLKIDDIYKCIAEDVESRLNTSNSEKDWPLSKRKNKNVTGLIKYELGGQKIKKFVGLRAKPYSYLMKIQK